MEEYARVLDYLPQGKTTGTISQSLVQLVGEGYFTLLEATVKPDATVVVGTRVYVGRNKRDVVDKILGRITYSKLTASAKEVLPEVVKSIVKERESYFISFINKAGPISIRVHTLELLPTIGKKTISAILEERKKKLFKGYEDIKERISGADIVSALANRIVDEIKGEEKHYLFVKPFVQKGFRRR